MARYSTNAEWHDPYESHGAPVEERRRARRFPASLRVSLEVPHPAGRYVGPGRVENLSLSGASLITKHALEPGHRVTVAIPTAGCPDSHVLPETFTGVARVVRLHGVDGKKRAVALAFGDDLLGNMEFAVFVNSLEVSAPRIA